VAETSSLYRLDRSLWTLSAELLFASGVIAVSVPVPTSAPLAKKLRPNQLPVSAVEFLTQTKKWESFRNK